MPSYMWSRRHILTIPKLLSEFKDRMSSEVFEQLINRWADLIESSNPEFRRAKFLRECKE